MENKEKCVIVGGGAAGLMCAARLTAGGVTPLVLEAGARVGKKILVSGNGRCNLSNSGVSEKKYNAPSFVAPVLEKYSFAEAVKPFQSDGKNISHCSTPEYSVTVGVKE